MKQRVLVIGGAGYVGSVLCRRLLEDGYRVTVLDNLSFNQQSLLDCCRFQNFDFERGDFRDLGRLVPVLQNHDIIIPLAAIVGQPACDKDPQRANDLNYDAHRAFMKCVSSEQIVVFPATQSGYGVMQSEELCDENSPLKPISLYGRSKVDIEKEFLDSLSAITLRSATVFGMSPRMRVDLLVNDFCYRAHKDGVIALFDSGFRRNFIHVEDLAKAFIFSIENSDKMVGQAFNVGLSSANLTKRELCGVIKQEFAGLRIVEDEQVSDPDKRDYLVSNEKLEALGWTPDFSLLDGVKQMKTGFQLLANGYLTNV